MDSLTFMEMRPNLRLAWMASAFEDDEDDARGDDPSVAVLWEAGRVRKNPRRTIGPAPLPKPPRQDHGGPIVAQYRVPRGPLTDDNPLREALLRRLALTPVPHFEGEY